MNFIRLILTSIFVFVLGGTSFGAVNSLYLTIEGNTSSKRATINRLLTNGTALVGNSSNVPQVVNIATQTELDAIGAATPFADADSVFTATTVQSAISELNDNNASGPNAADGKVSWTQLIDVPTTLSGFVDEEYQLADLRLDELVSGTLTFQLSLDAGYVANGKLISTYTAITGNEMDLEKRGGTISISSDGVILTFAGIPTTWQVYSLRIVADASERIVGIPTAYSLSTYTDITSLTIPANRVAYVSFIRESGRWVLIGEPENTTGTGNTLALSVSPSITTPNIIGVIGYQDGVTQLFNPNGTNSGFNFGSFPGNPSSADDGDSWYNSTTNKVMVRENGVNIAVTDSTGSGLASTDIDTSAEMRAILTDETGTGFQVYSDSPTFTGTVTMGTLNVTSIFADALEFNDTNDTHQLSMVLGSDLTADRIFTLVTGDSARTLTLSGNATISDWFDQSVKVAASPTFAAVTVTGEAYDPTGWDGDDTVATKNDIRDKIQTMGGGLASTDLDTSAELRTLITDENGTGAILFDGATSPTFVTPTLGAATATTPSAGDSDGSVATTLFVQTETDGTKTGSHAAPYTTASATSPTWTGQFHAVYMGVAQTVNLPAAAGYDGKGILIYNTGAFTITVDANGSEVIVRDGTVQTGGVSMTLSSGAGNYVAFICDGTRWISLGFKGTLTVGS